ncbi:MAG: CYTH domain-containing protein [Chthoniobacterales bacterium]|nr:CYTH domain-containing protein [Chthoniobacterales bacterium]
MGVEIERKFLVAGDAWRGASTGSRHLQQGYICAGEGNTVRVRTDGARAWVTIKGEPQGIRRPEFEYGIPAEDADGLLALCGTRIVEKVRHLVPHGGRVFEVDEFLGANAGLIVAELELRRVDENVSLPSWIGREVSGDPRYANAALSLHPFGAWTRP